LDFAAIRKKLGRWYTRHQRDLPWRRTRDPYAIWISEIMLQQTRVAAVVPYYERFLARFPNAASLASADEAEVLTLWSGLGYYTRARNLRKAARRIADVGGFPKEYEDIRELPGVGAYTAAAVASIAFGLPYAVVDGNVQRVVTRLANDAEADTQSVADGLLDRYYAGRSNQALMELGALVCLPHEPLCGVCPIAANCGAHQEGTQSDLPRRHPKPKTVYLKRTLLVIRRRDRILLTPSALVQGFWDLPEPARGACSGKCLGAFRHTISNRQYSFEVRQGSAERAPRGMRWASARDLQEIPLSTIARKALRLVEKSS
jgi:A/G-specific adenine glycosylase